MKKYLWNPFYYFDEKRLFVSGFIITIIGITFSIFFRVIQDGIFDLHIVDESCPWHKLVLAPVINIALTTLLFYIGARWINKKVRIIDIFNVSMISRWPLYLVIPLIGNPVILEHTNDITNALLGGGDISLNTTALLLLTIISIGSLISLTYYIILLFLGFKVASNAHQIKHYVLFGFLLLFAEVISIIIYHFIF